MLFAVYSWLDVIQYPNQSINTTISLLDFFPYIYSGTSSPM